MSVAANTRAQLISRASDILRIVKDWGDVREPDLLCDEICCSTFELQSYARFHNTFW